MDPNQIINRFEQLNRTRIERLSKRVSLQQEKFFKLLPFFLHTNVPELPGYGGKETPVGIIGYQADDKTINEAQKLSPSFRYKRQGIRHYGLAGLYLINEYGLLNIPSQLTFTVYVIHTDINPEQHQALEHKLRQLTQWATNLEITLDIELLRQDKLQSNPLNPEHLEQLYLNGLILAGGIPFWWLVPPGEDYKKNVQQLTQHRVHTQHELLDFGELEPTSPQALAENACKAIAFGIESGLNHLLPMLYNQSLLEHYPSITRLSNGYKKAVYDGEREPLSIDCRVLQFKLVSNSKLTTNSQRLAQQSLYIQAQEALSKHVSQPRFPWRRDFIKKASETWGWPNHEFQILDRRDIAKYQQCLEENTQTQTAFSQVQTTIKQFAKQHQLTLPKSNMLSDKKIQSYADNKPNIIGSLPRELLAKSAEEEIHLYRFSNHDGWKLSLVPLSSEKQTPLYHNGALLHVLSWAIFNGLLNKATRILIADKTHLMTIKTVISLVQQLLRSPLTERKPSDKKSDLTPPKLDQLLLFANLEQNKSLVKNTQGVQLTSLHNDPFNYANRGESLVYSIDGLIRATTGEWQTFETKGKTAPIDLFSYLISWWANDKSKTVLSCWCPSDTHGPLISQRLNKLYNDVNTHYHKNVEGNYLAQIADTLYQLNWQPEGVDISELKSTDISQYLIRSKKHFSVSKLDDNLDPTERLNALLNCQQKDTISLIIEQTNQTNAIHILDEFGNLISNRELELTQDTAIIHFQRFLNLIQRHNPNLKLRYFRITASTTNKPWKLTPLPVPSPSEKQSYLPVVITMASPKEDAFCTINCGPKQFSGPANDKALFKQISSFILSLRKSHIPYPLYINEINFDKPHKVTTLDYLLQKQRIEKHLNID
jgi:adenylate cyclase class 1